MAISLNASVDVITSSKNAPFHHLLQATMDGPTPFDSWFLINQFSSPGIVLRMSNVLGSIWRIRSICGRRSRD